MNKTEIAQILRQVATAVEGQQSAKIHLSDAMDIFELGFDLGTASAGFESQEVSKEVYIDHDLSSFGLNVTVEGNVEADMTIDPEDIEWRPVHMGADDRESAKTLIRDWAGRNFVDLDESEPEKVTVPESTEVQPQTEVN